MAFNHQFAIDVIMNFTSKGLDMITKSTSKVEGATNAVKNNIEKAETNSKGFSDNIDGATKPITKIEKDLGSISKKMSKISFDFLALRFGGVGLQRIFGGLFRTLSQGYLQTSGDTNRFAKSVGRLSASFEFLKFSIFNAFAENDLIQRGIEWIIKAVNNFSHFIQQYPTLGSAIVLISGALLLLGKALVIAGLGSQIFMPGGTFTAMLNIFKKLTTWIGNTATAQFIHNKMVGKAIALQITYGKVATSSVLTTGLLSKTMMVSATSAGLVGIKYTKLITIFKFGVAVLKGFIFPILAVVAGMYLLEKNTEKTNRFLERFGIIGNTIRIIINLVSFAFNEIIIAIKSVGGWIKKLTERFESLKKIVEPIGKIIGGISKWFKESADATENAVYSSREYRESLSKTKDVQEEEIETLENLNDNMFDTNRWLKELTKGSKNFDFGDLNTELDDMENHLFSTNELLSDFSFGLDLTEDSLLDYNSVLSDSQAPLQFERNVDTTIIPAIQREKEEINKLIEAHNILQSVTSTARRFVSGIGLTSQSITPYRE